MNEDAIRQVQKSTAIPPPRRTQEDIDREVAEASKDFYYERKPEETKKYGFQRASDLDALLKRKQKVASVEVDITKMEHSPAVPPTLPAPPRRSRGSDVAAPALPAAKPKPRQTVVEPPMPKPLVLPKPKPAPTPAPAPAGDDDFMSHLLSTRRASGVMRETRVRCLGCGSCVEVRGAQACSQDGACR